MCFCRDLNWFPSSDAGAKDRVEINEDSSLRRGSEIAGCHRIIGF